MKRKPRAETKRTVERKQVRSAARLAADRERLFELEPGGAPGAALQVQSPSVIDVHVARVACPRCDGKLELLEQAAVTIEGARLREARLKCRGCGSERSLWFRIVSDASN
jgi:hypothetical protein